MSDNQLTESKVGELLDLAYEKYINRIPGKDRNCELSENFMAKHLNG